MRQDMLLSVYSTILLSKYLIDEVQALLLLSILSQ